jgi:hypothetical protein
LDFLYKSAEKVRRGQLTQGDLIARTEAVEDVLKQAHQYYASAPHYTHFVIITQSCDLVKRSGSFNAPYITIAAAQPLKRTIDSFVGGFERTVKNADFNFFPSSARGKAKQLLERHLNNTEPEYFFLPKSPTAQINDDLLVYLRLSIALRKDHYDVLAGAKIAELKDVFQAKLGWLKGNIYSRVATPDIEESSPNSSELK